MFKLDLEKAEEPEIKLPSSVGSLKKQEHSRKTSTSASVCYSKASLNIWKFSVHVLLKPRLENFDSTLLMCEMSAIVQ